MPPLCSVCVSHTLQSALESGQEARIVQIDFSAAFDRVNHQGILYTYLGSQVAADGGCGRDVVHRLNEGYRAWASLKSVLSNRGLGIKAKKCLYEGVIVYQRRCTEQRHGV